MKAVIIYNDYLNINSLDYCVEKLNSACINKSIEPVLISGREAALNIYKILQTEPDFVIMRDKFPNLAYILEQFNIKVFNSSDTIRICDDKAEMSAVLESKKILRPLTLLSPQTYGKEIGEAFLDEVAKKLKYPVIIKKIRSSYGIGVYKAESREELLKFADCKEPLVFERFIPVPYGQDIRVFIVGNRVIGAIRRKGKRGEFRSNIELGGSGSSVILSDRIKNLALSAISAVGADYGGVDIIDASDPVVLEVNASAGFKSLDEINGIDTASYIIDYITEKIND